MHTFSSMSPRTGRSQLFDQLFPIRPSDLANMFVITAQMFAQPGKINTVVEALKPEAAAVKTNEDRASAYYFFTGREEPHTSVAFGIEIYEDRADLEKTHNESASFKTLVANARPSCTRDFVLEEFEPADVGFLLRPGGYSKQQSKDATPMFAYFTTAPGKREAVIDKLRPLAAEVEAKEPNCWSYKFFRGLQDENRFVIFERYASLPDLKDTHNSGKTFNDVFAELDKLGWVKEKTLIVGEEPGSGPLGFLERS
ncbi:uncharacterized protein V1510DRAFT_424317 [Dipodascopsis tothii]|uniref:uncharacterized protein n=1 Tax=Dipodascopsis tothii TaxID=44089 RepID=UPI0034CD8456